MCDAAGQLANRFHLLSLAEFCLQQAPLLLDLLPVGDVTPLGNEHRDLAVVVANRLEREVDVGQLAVGPGMRGLEANGVAGPGQSRRLTQPGLQFRRVHPPGCFPEQFANHIFFTNAGELEGRAVGLDQGPVGPHQPDELERLVEDAPEAVLARRQLFARLFMFTSDQQCDHRHEQDVRHHADEGHDGGVETPHDIEDENEQRSDGGNQNECSRHAVPLPQP